VSSRIARRALAEKRGVAELVLEEKLLTQAEIDTLLRVDAMTAPSRIKFMKSAGNILG
jgi:aspartate ammonia-lyase